MAARGKIIPRLEDLWGGISQNSAEIKQSLTQIYRDGKIPELPPSSRGLGRSPFKAKTGVRISVGAQAPDLSGAFLLTTSREMKMKTLVCPLGGDAFSVGSQAPELSGAFFIPALMN
jgi:hypothetical protein